MIDFLKLYYLSSLTFYFYPFYSLRKERENHRLQILNYDKLLSKGEELWRTLQTENRRLSDEWKVIK